MRVSLSTVAYWVRRAGEERLDRVDWSDQSHRPKRLARQHPLTMIQAVLRTRRWLRRFDALGDYGPAAIRDHLLAQGQPVPCERTIARWVTQAEPEVVKRRWPRPPRGWYLPSVANASSELDRVDVVEGLRLSRRGRVEVLNCLSLWESLPGSHPAVRITTTETLHWLGLHWRKHGRPHYVQFDNDTIFSGAHARRDYLGRLVHWCLCLGALLPCLLLLWKRASKRGSRLTTDVGKNGYGSAGAIPASRNCASAVPHLLMPTSAEGDVAPECAVPGKNPHVCPYQIRLSSCVGSMNQVGYIFVHSTFKSHDLGPNAWFDVRLM